MTRSKTHGPKYETNYGNWEYLDMISNYVSISIHLHLSTSYHGGELVLFSRTVSWRMLIRHTSILTGIFRPDTIL